MAESSESSGYFSFDNPGVSNTESKPNRELLQSMMRNIGFARPKYKKDEKAFVDVIDLHRYDPTYNQERSGLHDEYKIPKERPKRGSFVNYKFKDRSTSGDLITSLVTNARVLESDPCFVYEHYDERGEKDPIIGPGGKDNIRDEKIMCINQLKPNTFSWDDNTSPISLLRVPYDVTIADENKSGRAFSAVKGMFNTKEAGSRVTRKYKKKRSRGSKKRRGSVKRRTRKRKNM
jgi:hypothetical protein